MKKWTVSLPNLGNNKESGIFFRISKTNAPIDITYEGYDYSTRKKVSTIVHLDPNKLPANTTYEEILLRSQVEHFQYALEELSKNPNNRALLLNTMKKMSIDNLPLIVSLMNVEKAMNDPSTVQNAISVEKTRPYDLSNRDPATKKTCEYLKKAAMAGEGYFLNVTGDEAATELGTPSTQEHPTHSVFIRPSTQGSNYFVICYRDATGNPFQHIYSVNDKGEILNVSDNAPDVGQKYDNIKDLFDRHPVLKGLGLSDSDKALLAA